MFCKIVLLFFQDQNLHHCMPFSTLLMKDQQLYRLLRLLKEALAKENVELSGTTGRSMNVSWPSLVSILVK